MAFSGREQEAVIALVEAVSKTPAAIAALPADAARELKILARRVNSMRRQSKRDPERAEGNQRSISFSFVGRDKWRRKKRWKKYPDQMVLDARTMRANEYTYTEISDALFRDYKIRVPWITVRDWVQFFYRSSR